MIKNMINQAEKDNDKRALEERENKMEEKKKELEENLKQEEKLLNEARKRAQIGPAGESYRSTAFKIDFTAYFQEVTDLLHPLSRTLPRQLKHRPPLMPWLLTLLEHKGLTCCSVSWQCMSSWHDSYALS